MMAIEVAETERIGHSTQVFLRVKKGYHFGFAILHINHLNNCLNIYYEQAEGVLLWENNVPLQFL